MVGEGDTGEASPAPDLLLAMEWNRWGSAWLWGHTNTGSSFV